MLNLCLFIFIYAKSLIIFTSTVSSVCAELIGFASLGTAEGSRTLSSSVSVSVVCSVWFFDVVELSAQTKQQARETSVHMQYT